MKQAAERKKPMDIDQLSNKMDKGFEDMAKMVAKGFDEVKTDVNKVEQKMVKLDQKVEQNHEEIKLKLDNVAYRFELVELQRRVALLERKSSIKR